MDIGEDVTQALSAMGDASDSQVEAIAVAALAVILGEGKEASVLVGSVFEELDVDFIKKSYSAFVCLFVEAAKIDLSTSMLHSHLRSECGFTDVRGDLVCHVFKEKKDEVRGVLALTGNHSYVTQLLGVDWKLDYCVSTSGDRAVRELLYRVSLKTLDRVQEREDKIEFVAGVEELQDLVSRLKDACKSVERTLDRR